MKRDLKMIMGYIVGGLLVLGLLPTFIYVITSLLDNVYKVQIINNLIIRWIIIIVLLAIGFIYAIWSIVIQNTIGKGGPAVIGNLEISPETKNLVVTGPYKTTRNPMLFGAFLIYLAFALFMNSLTSVILVMAFFVFMLTVVVRMEEKRLLKDFGDQYEEYRHKVPKFFPRVSSKSK
jgi:protein-S-isoprenylcysteine O-methyltransferase Ste14